MKDLVSIIVPVYNASLYLERLNHSLVNQSYKNLEIIYVNDGSTDNSLEILYEFKNNDDRILIVNQENSGPAISRNTGLIYSTGKYVTFADSDDFIDYNMIEKMYQKIIEEEAEIVICNYRDIFVDGTIARVNNNAANFYGNSIYQNPELLFIKPAVWNKMIKKDLIYLNDIKFEKAHIGEDLAFTLKLLSKTNKVVGITDVLYNYVLHQNTISRTYDLKVLDLLDSLDNIQNYFKEQQLLESFKEEIDYIIIQNILYQITKVPLIKENESQIYQELVEYLLKIDNLYKNKYVKRSLVYSIIIRLFPKKFFVFNPVSQCFLRLVSTSDVAYKLMRKLDK